MSDKAELIDAVAGTVEGMTKANAAKALDAVVAGIGAQVKKSGSCLLVGFGTFRMKERKAREGRNPATGEKIKIPARKAVTFKASKELNGIL